MREIARSAARCKVILLAGAPEQEELLGAVRAGAVGYVGKELPSSRLPDVVRGVLSGETALPRRLTLRVLEELRGEDRRRAEVSQNARAPLTDREWEVLQLLAARMRTAEIGTRMRISEVTVRRHVSSLVAKLGVSDRSGAIRLFRSGG